MNSDEIKSQLVEEGELHEDSVEELLRHHRKMKFHLKNGDFEASGVHVGKFCENVANILRELYLGGVVSNPEVGTVVDQVTSQGHTGDPDAMKLTVPRFLRATYEIRNRRNVHVNLDLPVSHSDTQTAVRMCTWMLAELIRVHGLPDDMDEIKDGLSDEQEEQLEEVSEEIEGLASINNPLVEEHRGKILVNSTELSLTDEILVILYFAEGEVKARKLAKSIPNKAPQKVTKRLGNLKQQRMIFYEDSKAKIAGLGREKAEEVIDELEVKLNE
jgi:hypothetical protein